MRRVWLSLLGVLTLGVLGAMVYVLSHNQKVPNAGSVDSTPPPASGVSASSAPASGTGSSKPAGPSTIAFIGDDWTAGTGALPGMGHWPAKVAANLHLKLLKTAAAPGGGYAKKSPSGSNYLSLIPQLGDINPDLIVVTGGRNDTSDDPTTLKHSTKLFFQLLHSQYPRSKIYALAPFWGDSPHPAALKQVADAIKAGMKGIKRCVFLGMPDPIHGHPEWMANANDPNDNGYAALAKAVTAELKKKLAGASASQSPSGSGSASGSSAVPSSSG